MFEKCALALSSSRSEKVESMPPENHELIPAVVCHVHIIESVPIQLDDDEEDDDEEDEEVFTFFLALKVSSTSDSSSHNLRLLPT